VSVPANGVLRFRGSLHHNPYVPAGGGEVHAVLDLRSSWERPPEQVPGVGPAEVLILDGSGSMDRDGKREHTVEAACAAVLALPDGVCFAVIAGDHDARMLCPGSPGLVVADDENRRLAVAAVRRLKARGGTAIGGWLALAATIVEGHPNPVRHATLVTDGRNEHEGADALDDAVRKCVGLLRCDCRGIGADFDPAELYNIAEKLGGTVRADVDPAELADDVVEVTTRAAAKAVVTELELLTTTQASVRSVRQVRPMIAQLEPMWQDAGRTVSRYRLGDWGGHDRAVYHVCLAVEPWPGSEQARTASSRSHVLAERLAARLSVTARDEAQPDAPAIVQSYERDGVAGVRAPGERGSIQVAWTTDPMAALTPDAEVAAVLEGVDLADKLRAGLTAWREGKRDDANERLRAVRDEAGRAGDTALRARLDAVYDERSRTFLLDARDEVELFEESTVTTRLD
jgi:hypothetical protein